MIMDKAFILTALQEGALHLEGQFVYGSNYTFMAQVRYEGQTFTAVYKPSRGERPLWDFPNQTLARRETAAYLVSEALGWQLVPPTVFRLKEAPLGPGSAQLFIEHDPDYHYFNFSEEDHQRMPMVMLFDLLINNADRKAGHVLIDPDDQIWLIDHGLCFHVENKLRTVIWDFAGEAIPPDLLDNIHNLLPTLAAGQPLYQSLQPHLLPEEIDALVQRGQALVDSKSFPQPPEDRRAFPWPPV